MDREDIIINRYRNLKTVKKMSDDLHVAQSNVISGKITKEAKENLAKMIIREICSFIEDFYKEDFYFYKEEIDNEKRKNPLDK